MTTAASEHPIRIVYSTTVQCVYTNGTHHSGNGFIHGLKKYTYSAILDGVGREREKEKYIYCTTSLYIHEL
jgi:hypothetical protein